jgi:hypothetical protein
MPNVKTEELTANSEVSASNEKKRAREDDGPTETPTSKKVDVKAEIKAEA